MKKVCLITYAHSPNYGAALQLFATYNLLERFGCEVSVLNYQNQFEASHDSLKFLLTNAKIKEKLRYFIGSFIFGGSRNASKNFDAFYNDFKYTNRLSSKDELLKMDNFELFCVGSDQVWNPSITQGFDEVFCLNVDGLPRKISYASSMGSINLGKYDENSFIEALRRFDYISVRENIALQFLSKKLNKEVKKVVDPTLLFDKKKWNEIISTKKFNTSIKDKYVLVYALGGHFGEINKIAHDIAEQIGAKVATITLSNRPKKVDYLLNHVTPFEFVSLVSGANFIVTNSFHGTCFSIIYEKPFYSVAYGDNPVRAKELLLNYGLENRFFEPGDIVSTESLNLDDVKRAQVLLDQDVQSSINWFKNAVYGGPK